MLNACSIQRTLDCTRRFGIFLLPSNGLQEGKPRKGSEEKRKRGKRRNSKLVRLLDFVLSNFKTKQLRPQVPSHLFFKYNAALGPPYHILLDTNFLNFAIQNKLDVMQSAMDCLLAKCKSFFSSSSVRSPFFFSCRQYLHQ